MANRVSFQQQYGGFPAEGLINSRHRISEPYGVVRDSSMAKKGTVRDISSLFPAEEVHKASMRVQDTITKHHRELDTLKTFVDDNTNLINLVRKLPDETHHDIMVPFGPAAFFPGRMTNPNKFLVLLGEGYHAERSAKQTVEILKRRGKALVTQVESLHAVMEDLKLEASFFDNTALESEEGLVEIREDYDEEEAPSSTAPTSELCTRR